MKRFTAKTKTKQVATPVAVLMALVSTPAFANECAKLKPDQNVSYQPIALCTQISKGEGPNSYQTIVEADICVTRTVNRRLRRNYAEIMGPYKGVARKQNITNYSYLYTDTDQKKQPGVRGQILGYGKEGMTALYDANTGLLTLQLQNPTTGVFIVDAVLNCKAIR
jgi:hypothetical protein